MTILRKQLWACTGVGWAPGEAMDYLHPSSLSLSTFWVNPALLCSPDQSSARQLNEANELDKNGILASVMIQFPKVSDAVSHFKITGFQDKAGGQISHQCKNVGICSLLYC